MFQALAGLEPYMRAGLGAGMMGFGGKNPSRTENIQTMTPQQQQMQQMMSSMAEKATGPVAQGMMKQQGEQ